MTYVEVWSEQCDEYYVNIVTEGKRDVNVDEMAKTKDRSLASFIAKELAKRQRLNIEFRING